MLDIKFIRENADRVKDAVKNKNCKIDIDAFLELDKQRRGFLVEVEDLKAKRNKASDEIGKLIKDNKQAADEKKEEMKLVSQKIKEIEIKVEELDKKIAEIVYLIPNIYHNSIPVGPDKASNKVVKEWGTSTKFDFEAKDHVDLADKLGVIDFARGVKISERGFILYTGVGARLERALINFMLDLHTKKHGYIEMYPPFLVNRQTMTGTGQLPKFEEDMYRLKDDDLFLVPTAEVPLTNIYRDEILEEGQLPLYVTAYTACFRREAGSYGKETRGLSRVHQFDKIELVKFVKPEGSYDELEKLLKDALEVIELLKIPYRVVCLASGDLSFSAAKCYDIEIWAGGSKQYLEVSSCSNFEDFQARRANIKYRDSKTKKPAFIHTLNGSGVALARLVISILENNQNIDGSVNIPQALIPYMDGLNKIEPKA